MQEKIYAEADFAKEEGVFVEVGEFLRHKDDNEGGRKGRHLLKDNKSDGKAKHRDDECGQEKSACKGVDFIVEGRIHAADDEGKDFAGIHSALAHDERGEEKAEGGRRQDDRRDDDFLSVLSLLHRK